MRAMVAQALDNPVGQPPLRERLRQLKSTKASPKASGIVGHEWLLSLLSRHLSLLVCQKIT